MVALLVSTARAKAHRGDDGYTGRFTEASRVALVASSAFSLDSPKGDQALRLIVETNLRPFETGDDPMAEYILSPATVDCTRLRTMVDKCRGGEFERCAVAAVRQAKPPLRAARALMSRGDKLTMLPRLASKSSRPRCSPRAIMSPKWAARLARYADEAKSTNIMRPQSAGLARSSRRTASHQRSPCRTDSGPRAAPRPNRGCSGQRSV